LLQCEPFSHIDFALQEEVCRLIHPVSGKDTSSSVTQITVWTFFIMKESHSKQLNFPLCGALIRFVFILISLFAWFGSSYHLKEASADVGPATLSDSGNLTEDCARIHNVLRREFLFLNKSKGDISYRVRLKLFTVHQDTLDILKMPAFANIEPMAIFNKDKHRGFTAELTKKQVCELYHLPIVLSES
jgi:hypothetical protein